MKKHQSLAVFGVLTSALLIGCDGDLDLSPAPGNENPNTNAMNVRIPKSLQAADDTTDQPAEQSNGQSNEDSNNQTDSSAVTKDAVKDVEVIVGGLDAATAGAPSQALYLGAELLSERVEFAQEALDEIDSAWEQISSYCASVTQGDECEIPAGTLTGDSEASDFGYADDLLSTALTYQSNPDDTYDHSLTRKFSEDFTETEELRWNADRSLIAMSIDSSWQDEDGAGSQSSDLHFSENTEGDQISLRDEFTMGDSTFTDFQQLHQLNDGLNGVEVKSEFNWSDAYNSGQWQSHAVANDEGGKLATTASFDGEDSIWHSRETFDDDGGLVSSEYCEQTSGVDCGDPANWTTEEIDSDVEFIDVEFDETGNGLDEAFEIACAEMDDDASDCGFSETEMTVLHGAFDIFDNTDDVTVYLCIETGEDELACRAQDSDDGNAVFDIEDGATEIDEYSFIENGDSDGAPESGEVVEISEIDAAELIDLELIESIDDIHDGVVSCVTDGDGEAVCDIDGEAFEVVDAAEINELLEGYVCDHDVDCDIDGEAFEVVDSAEINELLEGYFCDGDANCDIDGEAFEVVDATEITELLEGHVCAGEQDDSDDVNETDEDSDAEGSACVSVMIEELAE